MFITHLQRSMLETVSIWGAQMKKEDMSSGEQVSLL
jgi:hypothetical protein